jgi:hypothetical protein
MISLKNKRIIKLNIDGHIKRQEEMRSKRDNHQDMKMTIF